MKAFLTHLKSSSNLLLPGGFSRVGATPVARAPVPSLVNSELFEPNIPFVLMPGNPPFLYFAASAPGAAERRRLPAAVALDIRAPSCKFEELPIPVVERVGGGVRDPCMPIGLGDAVTVPGKQHHWLKCTSSERMKVRQAQREGGKKELYTVACFGMCTD